MFKKDNIIKHFTNIDNAITYGLFLFIIIIGVFNDEVGKAVLSIAIVAYLVSGILIAGHIMRLETKLEFRHVLAYLYYISYSILLVYEVGFQRKTIILLMPLMFGFIICGASLFMGTGTYQKINNWERKSYKKIFNKFKKKT